MRSNAKALEHAVSRVSERDSNIVQGISTNFVALFYICSLV